MLPLSLLAFRSLASNRLRSGIVAMAVLLGIGAFSGVQFTNEAISRGLEQAWRKAVGASHLQVRSFGSTGFSDDTVARVRQIPDVTAVAPIARKRVFYEHAQGRGFVELIAVDAAVEQQVRGYRMLEGRFVGSDQPDGVAVRSVWAQEQGLRLGDPVALMTQDGLQSFQVMGLLASDEAGIADVGAVVLTDLATARQRFGMQNQVGALWLVLTSDQAAPATRQQLARTIRQAHVIRQADQIREEFSRSVSELQGLLTLFGATALFVAIFLILNTIEMTVVDQTRQIGQLRAAGATRRQVFAYFLEQGLLPGAVGALAGSAVGFGLAQGLATWIARTQDVAVGAVGFSPPIFLVSIVLGLVVVTLSSLLPSLRGSRMDAIEMVQQSEALAEGRADWRVVAAGLALMMVSAVAMTLPMPEGIDRWLRAALLFPLLTGLVLASRVTVIPLGRLFGAVVQRFGGASSRLAARNVSREVGRTALTLAGFMISLSLLVALAGVAASSVRAGERWTRSLVPTTYVVVSPVDQPAVLAAQFTGSGISYATPVLFFSAQSGNFLLPLASIEPSKFVRGFDFVQGSAEPALRALESGGAVLVPRRIADRRGLALGDTVQLRTVAGPQPFQVAGVVAHSFPSASGGQTVLVSASDAERLFGRTGFRILMVEPESGAEPAAVRDQLRERAERYGMSATTADGIASDVERAIFRLLALVGTLVAIGLLVAAFGTANTMTMNVAQRARELSILWAVGMSRMQLGAMTVAEATMIGLMGGILGVAVGALLSWLLVSLARTSGFEPQYVFPLPAAIAALFVATVAASVASLIPAWRAARIWTS